MSLHDVMLSNDDLLAAIDLTVDFHGNEASVEEHGMVLLDVNRNHLCVQHEADLDQTEWWPTAHCMFGLQACLDNDGSTTCDQAESGSEDDLAMTWRRDGPRELRLLFRWRHVLLPLEIHGCGMVRLDKTCGVSRLAKKSSGRAAQADDGATLWVTIDGIKYTYAEGAAYGGTNTEEGFGAWAASVMGVVCQGSPTTRAKSCRIVRWLLPPDWRAWTLGSMDVAAPILVAAPGRNTTLAARGRVGKNFLMLAKPLTPQGRCCLRGSDDTARMTDGSVNFRAVPFNQQHCRASTAATRSAPYTPKASRHSPP